MEKPKFGFNKLESYIEFSNLDGKSRLGIRDGKVYVEKVGTQSILLDENGEMQLPLGDDVTINNAILKYGVALRCIKTIVGGIGVPGCDLNFASAANMDEQVIDLGLIIPSRGKLVDFYMMTDVTFTGAITLVADAGLTSGGAELISSGTIYAAEAVRSVDASSTHVKISITAAGRHLYVNVTPGANWNLVTAGKMTIYVFVFDVDGL